jgi:hypothetical protein
MARAHWPALNQYSGYQDLGSLLGRMRTGGRWLPISVATG